jgi:hypothetical protein
MKIAFPTAADILMRARCERFAIPETGLTAAAFSAGFPIRR